MVTIPSLARDDCIFQDLQLDETLAKYHVSARCGLLVIDLLAVDTVNWISIERDIGELFNVGVLPNLCCPTAIG